jgi:hypothetical protein
MKNKKLKLMFLLFIFLAITFPMNKCFNYSKKQNIENLQNIAHFDIIHRLFSLPEKGQTKTLSNIRKGKLQNFTRLGGNAGPNIL